MRSLALNGAELIAPYATPIADPWENFLTTRALENGVYLAACNHVGQEGGWRMSGKSMLIDPGGKILAQASGTEERVLSMDLDRQVVIDTRRLFPLFRDRRPETYGALTASVESLLP